MKGQFALPPLPRRHGGIGRCNECRTPICNKRWNAADAEAVILSKPRDA